ncbi:MAG: hypothetical protein WBD55_13610 [Dehalococcoidia bacterium]
MMTTTKAKGFDASKYLTDVNGKDYLEVKWRLLWLRTEHPDALIETELVKHEACLALFRARVTIPGAGQATGWGSETPDDFGDYIEKAETKALGRALAALGYGTQFCEDFDFSAEVKARRTAAATSSQRHPARPVARRTEASHPVVDSPVARPNDQGRGLSVVSDQRSSGATSPQMKAIYAIGRDQHLDEEAIEERCRARFGLPPAQLSKRQASEFIEALRKPKVHGVVASTRSASAG